MKVAEELYQAGFISYPRTETDKFSENHDLQIPVNEQTRHPLWGQYAQRLLDPQQNLWRNPGNGGHDDKAHPPIHPTRFSEGEANWTNDHKVCFPSYNFSGISKPNTYSKCTAISQLVLMDRRPTLG
jgi:DNA topoisomerase-3